MRVVRPPIFNLTTYWRSGTLGCWQDLDPHMPWEASDAMSILFLGSWSVFQKKHSSFRDKDTLTCSFVQSEGFREKLSGVSLGVSVGAGRSERSGRPEARSGGSEGSRGTRTGLLRRGCGSGLREGPWTWARSAPAWLPGAHREKPASRDPSVCSSLLDLFAG